MKSIETHARTFLTLNIVSIGTVQAFPIFVYYLILITSSFQNSNILSAVLCLIKELDAPSLEVAEMAIRCRMEELDD